MTEIFQMTFLGIIAGMFSAFFTRITRKNMIFRRFGKYLESINNRHLIDHTIDSILVMLVRCVFCLTPWIVLLLSLLYILEYHPWWLYASIGIVGALGSGNFVCELVTALRNEDI